jgi:hypothetical protein
MAEQPVRTRAMTTKPARKPQETHPTQNGTDPVLSLSPKEIWGRLRSKPGWEERAQSAQRQADAGETVSLEELRRQRQG